MFKTWLKEAGDKVVEKGHSDLFFEKLIPATTKNKFDINTNDVTNDDMAKFMAEWKKRESRLCQRYRKAKSYCC